MKLKLAISVILLILLGTSGFIALQTEIEAYKVICGLLFVLSCFTSFVIGAIIMSEHSEEEKQKKININYTADT